MEGGIGIKAIISLFIMVFGVSFTIIYKFITRGDNKK